MVLHHSERGWTGSVAFEELIDLDADTLAAVAGHVPRFRFVLDDISAVTDEALRARAMSALGRLVLWCLRYARAPEQFVERLAGWADLMRDVKRGPGGVAALKKIWRYILNANDTYEPGEFIALLVQAAGEDIKEEIVTVADKLREEGRTAGLQEGERRTLLRQLRARFGTLPDAIVARVSAAGEAELDVWVDRVLTATSLADVLGAA